MNWRTTRYRVIMLSMVLLVCLAAWTRYVIPDPEIIPAEPPIVNRNVDANGVKLLAEGARFAIAPPEWVPVPATTFAPGETMYVLRNDCFFNKLAEPKVWREWICDIGGTFDAGWVTPPKMTPSGQCSRAQFAAIVDSRIPVPNSCAYAVKTRFFKSILEPKVDVPFAEVRIDIRARGEQ